MLDAMSSIAVVNQSTLVSDADVRLMVKAVAFQLAHHVAPAWERTKPQVVISPTPQAAPLGASVIGIFDDADQPGVLGWHTEDPGGRSFGRVFARPVLDNGGDTLTKALSVASVLSHEAIEWFIDPHVQLWADDANGSLYAVEACDPVEAATYVIEVRKPGPQPRVGHGITKVTVSDFVTPAYFDPLADPAGPFSYLRAVTKPFALAAGGYVVFEKGGKPTERFGEHYPAWRSTAKASPLARTHRRFAKAVRHG